MCLVRRRNDGRGTAACGPTSGPPPGSLSRPEPPISHGRFNRLQGFGSVRFCVSGTESERRTRYGGLRTDKLYGRPASWLFFQTGASEIARPDCPKDTGRIDPSHLTITTGRGPTSWPRTKRWPAASRAMSDVRQCRSPLCAGPQSGHRPYKSCRACGVGPEGKSPVANPVRSVARWFERERHARVAPCVLCVRVPSECPRCRSNVPCARGDRRIGVCGDRRPCALCAQRPAHLSRVGPAGLSTARLLFSRW